MGRSATTIFNPSLGIKYIVEDQNGNEVVGRTLGSKDKEHSPIRSNKDTPRGKEFFKMLIDGKVYKFRNSISYEECISSDKRWKFTGKRPNGKILLRSNRRKIEIIQDDLEFVSEDLQRILNSL